MTDAQTTTCPECETEQSKTAPFCQNCGYRMRSPKTMREPMLAPTTGAGGSNSSRKSSRPKRDMKSMSDDGEPESLPAQRPTRATGNGPDTIVEGMEAVGARPDDSSNNGDGDPAESGAHLQSGANVQRRDTARSTPIDANRSRTRWVVGATLVGCLGVIAGLSWLHLERQSDQDDARQVDRVSDEIVDIEAGTFRQGLSDDAEAYILEFCYRYHDDPERDCDRDRLLEGEVPQQTVDMPAFQIDAAPVINAEYTECVEAGACEAINYDDCDVWTPQGLQPGARVPQVLREDDRPVVCVNRSEAAAYCEFRDGQLPTHNQWEKAARGDDNVIYPWGNHWESDIANWGEMDVVRMAVPGKLDGYAWTSPPGAFPGGKSPKGVWDMAGNVAEWIREEDDELTGYVRGGSWVSNPFELRATAREQRDADARRTDIGLRCVY